jgi:hypothetical protein
MIPRYATAALEQSLVRCSLDLLDLAERKRPGDDVRTLRIAARSTRAAAYFVKFDVYDVETGYAWLHAAREYLHAEQQKERLG